MGIGSGDTTAFYSITAEQCASCHDGADLDVVEWTEPIRRADNLDFSHLSHAEEVEAEGDPAVGCEGCHVRSVENRMDVEFAVVATCIGCHAHQAEEHLAATTDCETCHLPLVQATGFTTSQIAEFPLPPDHEDPLFLVRHDGTQMEAGADCAICHARESCERCHLNGENVAQIAAMSTDDRIRELVSGLAGEWPEPANHEAPDWGWAHALEIGESIEGCANCHTQESCAACHLETSTTIARLPEARPGGPTGVVLVDVQPIGHGADFVAGHATAAAVGVPDCTVCHAQQQCADCHESATQPEFHPVDFVLRHGAEAFANETECAACHSREAFCRDCHTGVGLAAAGQRGGAFHDADPSWLLSHGKAARQGLEACTTCHQQSSCLSCHSAKSGLRVSPHGPNFDAARAADRSTQLCAVCHVDLPIDP